MRSEYLIGAIALLVGCTGSHSYDETNQTAKAQNLKDAAEFPKEAGRPVLSLACHNNEHLADVAGHRHPPPSPIRWYGSKDEQRLVRLGRKTEGVCALTLLEFQPPAGEPLSTSQLNKLAIVQAEAARCLLRVLQFGDPYRSTFERPFIPPLDGAGQCSADESLVIELQRSAESLFARAFEARAGEPEPCTHAPILARILQDQAFLVFARGDFAEADAVYARLENVCPSRGYLPLAALRRADVAYEAALAGVGDWERVDDAYARVERICHGATPEDLNRRSGCKRMTLYLQLKRALALLNANRTKEANDRFRVIVSEGSPRPGWLRVGWWCKLLDDDVLRWGEQDSISCRPEPTPKFGIIRQPDYPY